MQLITIYLMPINFHIPDLLFLHIILYTIILCGYIIEEFEDTKGVHIILHIQLKI